jgi:hypothetical protein
MSKSGKPTLAKTSSSVKKPRDQKSAPFTYDSNSRRELDRRLDHALEESFPASDPVSIVISVRNG